MMITVASTAIAVLVLFWLTGGLGTSVPAPALAAPLAPTVTALGPATTPNDLDTPIVISGTGFTTVPTVTLGDTLLDSVGWVSAERLTATVPWGMEPGVYTLTVENPGGEATYLSNAFT